MLGFGIGVRAFTVWHAMQLAESDEPHLPMREGSFVDGVGAQLFDAVVSRFVLNALCEEGADLIFFDGVRSPVDLAGRLLKDPHQKQAEIDIDRRSKGEVTPAAIWTALALRHFLEKCTKQGGPALCDCMRGGLSPIARITSSAPTPTCFTEAVLY